MNENTSNVTRFCWWLLLAATLLASAWLHARAGLTLPIPWDDEASFVWPAINLAERGTMVAPELNPDRPLMWMPPAFALLCAAFIKLVGFSLETLRWFSWVLLAATYTLLAIWFRRFPLRLIVLAFLSLAMLGGTFIAAGNIARMDVLTLLMAVVAFIFISRGRVWSAFATIALAALVHPNAAHFALAAFISALVLFRQQQWRPDRATVVLLVLAALAWSAYLLQILGHRDSFVADMVMQFERKTSRRPFFWLTLWPTPVWLALYALVALLAVRRRPELIAPVAFGAACLVISITGREMWYGVFDSLGWIILGCALLWLANDLLALTAPRARAVAIGVIVALLTVWHYRSGRIESPAHIPHGIEWWRMRIASDDTAYFTDADREAVAQRVRMEFPDGSAARIEFFPGGEALLFHRAFGSAASPFSARFTDIKPDAHVIHLSRHLPPDRREAYLKRIPPGSVPFHQRDQTEQWFFVRPVLK